MPLQTVTRTQVIELAKIMPMSKLASWYEYGLFIQSRPRMVVSPEAKEDEDAELMEEFAMWEAASDEDWLAFQEMLAEGT